MWDFINTMVYAAIVAVGGVGISLLAFGAIGVVIHVAVNKAWLMWNGAMTGIEIIEACAEWRKNHPEKWAHAKKRNGRTE